ncbi:MAG: transporter related protein [Marmoricola sp.]|jgi:branched-chain amino acid transport system ATP-binding protein|nr:transporter related protein [Marmoricola sp.]
MAEHLGHGTAVLGCAELTAGYGDLAAVRDVDIDVAAGEVVALIGPNGAGKTTTLLTMTGSLPPIKGKVLWMGAETTQPLHRRAKDGLTFVAETGSVFSKMTARENLRLAGVAPKDVTAFFPELEPLMGRQAGLLSGGEQQMLTVGRALAKRPRALVVDELSMGLAPVVVTRLLEAIRRAADELGTAVLMVEQQAIRALEYADRWYLLSGGAVSAHGDRSASDQALNAYLSADFGPETPAGTQV